VSAGLSFAAPQTLYGHQERLSRREIALANAKSVTDAPPEAVRGLIWGGRVVSEGARTLTA